MFVYAATSNDPVLTAANAYKNLNKRETSAFECSDCGNHMHVVASKSPEPYCISCGSDRVIESNRKIPETAAFVNDTELSSVYCKSCDTENVMPTSAVVAAVGKVHCVLCGSALKVVSADADSIDEPIVSDAAEPPVVDNGGGSMDAEGSDFPDLTNEETSDADPDATDDDEAEENADAIDDTADEGAEESEGFSEDADVVDVGDDVPDFSGLGEEEPGNEEELFLDAYDGGDAAAEVPPGEPLMDALELDDTPESLTFVSKAGALLAMKGAHVVAFANAKSVGRDSDILHTPEYATAVLMTAGRIGARKALAKFHFNKITVKPTDTAAVSRQVAVARSSFEDAQARKMAVFADSMAIAAAGLARGLWREAKNPIRAALEQQLGQSMAPRVARTTASRILLESGVEYSKTLVEYANKIASMSSNARKEYADMLNLVSDDADVEMSDMEDAPEVDDGEISDSVEDMDDVTSRLNTTASPSTATAALFQAPRSRNQGGESTVASAADILSGKKPFMFPY